VVERFSDVGCAERGERQCPLCGGRGRAWLEKRGYPHLRCERCDTGFLAADRRPEDLASLYGAEYFEGKRGCGYPGYLRDARLLDDNFDRRLAWIETLRGGGRLLEVGCAYGLFLRRARERGWDAVGVEIAEDCAREARRNAGVPVVAGDFLRAQLPGPFDVIALLDVIEHMPDPAACLERCAQLLVPDGLLVLETGDLSSRWARWLGRRWHFVDPPQHLFYFTPGGLEGLLRRCGFAGEFRRRSLGRQVSFANIAFKLAGRAAGPLLRMPGHLFLDLGDGMLVAAERAPRGAGG
jgi:SAM-dependent methyltransferase